MAEFEPAVTITLQNEGGFFHNQVTGEVVNHGITLTFVQSSGYKPDADASFIQNLSAAEASAIYETYFWNRYSLESIGDQSLANKVFDLSVNMGPAAFKLLQSAVNACGGQCAVDGVLGPVSFAQINGRDPGKLLGEFRALAAERYRGIAANNTELAGDLTGWLARLDS
jgi:lysozyme family protein